MSFPIEFAQRRGDYDFISPTVNFVGNAALVVVGGICLAAISYVALKALGFSELATALLTAIPTTIGAIAMSASGGGVTLCALFFVGMVTAFSHR